MDTGSNPEALAALLENHRAFLRYMERRVGERALAEDILQDAFAKVIAAPQRTPSEEAVIPWFYRSLRNAAIDQVRRRRSDERALQAFARELATQDTPAKEMETEICACVLRLAATLETEYAEVLEAVEIGGTSVKTFAVERGLSPGNAGACVNCTCRQA